MFNINLFGKFAIILSYLRKYMKNKQEILRKFDSIPVSINNVINIMKLYSIS